MHLITTKKTALASLTVLALATTSLTSADARPRHHARQHVAATQADSGVDDRYAHVQQNWMSMMMPAAAPQRRSSRAPRQAMAMGGMSFGSSGLVDQARRYIGTNPTGRSRLWCARFMNMVLERSGKTGTGSDMASSFSSFGRRVSGPQVGAIAVMSRGKAGGHVGIVSGVDESGNPIIISGNYNGRVAEASYSRGRIYAYVMP